MIRDLITKIILTDTYFPMMLLISIRVFKIRKSQLPKKWDFSKADEFCGEIGENAFDVFVLWDEFIFFGGVVCSVHDVIVEWVRTWQFIAIQKSSSSFFSFLFPYFKLTLIYAQFPSR